MKPCILVLSLLLCIESSLSARDDEHVKPTPAVVIGQITTVSRGNGTATPPNSTTPSNTTEAPNTTATPPLSADPETATDKNKGTLDSPPKNSGSDASGGNNKPNKNKGTLDSPPKNSGSDASGGNNEPNKNKGTLDSTPKNSGSDASGGNNKPSFEEWLKHIPESSNETILAVLKIINSEANIRGLLAEPTSDMAENVTPNTTVSTGQITTVQTTVSQANGTATPPNGATPPITTGVLNTTEVPKATEPPTEDGPETDKAEGEEKPHKPESDTSGGNNKSGPKPLSRTPDSSHFAVVFLVMIALLFGLYALYHNRQKIIAVVVEGRSVNGRGDRERYRKLDSESGLEPEARIKNSNEVYVY